MNGISNDNFSVEMPILTSFGGMTQYVTILRTAFSFFGMRYADTLYMNTQKASHNCETPFVLSSEDTALAAPSPSA